MPEVYGYDPYSIKYGISSEIHLLSFLVRLPPYSNAYVNKMCDVDQADRIFFSFEKIFAEIMNSKENNCEMIPHFFYLPEIFLN
mmetsp:Transcript_38152/g.27712  ORF Transcript_38152/g.27712 Transcript_38152/m.27712 type:complete len:84 (+) Transcript_38152:1763-2014(+)